MCGKAVVGLVVCCVAAYGAEPPAPPKPASSPAHPSSGTGPGTRNGTEVPPHQTAEELLRALQADRPLGEVIAPASRTGKAPLEAAQLLLPEGTALVDKEGKLMRQPGAWDFKTADGPQFTILPNGQLELMTAMQKDAGSPLAFVVSGEITVFGDRNYLLIKHVSRAGNQATGAPATDQAKPVAPTGSAEDVLSTLESQRPGAATAPTVGEAISAGDRQTGQALLEGTLVVRRSGRLTREGTHWFFSFDDQTSLGRGTVGVLPNQSLEIMIQAVARGSAGAVFVVSGDITEFEGRNFLLVRGVTRMLDMGNLRP